MVNLRWRLIWCPALLIATVLLAACWSETTVSIASVRSEPTTAARRLVAPDFSVGTGPNATFSLSDHRGDVVVLYFSFPG
jgi:hypothetical protein